MQMSMAAYVVFRLQGARNYNNLYLSLSVDGARHWVKSFAYIII